MKSNQPEEGALEVELKKLWLKIRDHGKEVSPRQNFTKELLGESLEIKNPRNRVLYNHISPINPFELFGRFFWEFSGKDDVVSISYYSKSAFRFASNKIIPSAYGKRIFNQLPLIHELFEKEKMSRRGTVFILSEDFHRLTDLEYPCVIALQFYIRDGKLDMVIFSRSESAYKILPMDIFLFTMFQDNLAHSYDKQLGTCKFLIGSAHLYEKDIKFVNDLDFCSDPVLNSFTMKELDWFSWNRWCYFEFNLRVGIFTLVEEVFDYIVEESYSHEFSQILAVLGVYSDIKHRNMLFTDSKFYYLLNKNYANLVTTFMRTNPEL